MATVITDTQDIQHYRDLALWYALKLEMKGMTRRGRSAYALCKERWNLTGSKQSVFDAVTIILKKQEDRLNETGRSDT